MCVDEARGGGPWLNVEEEVWGREDREPCSRGRRVEAGGAMVPSVAIKTLVVLLTSMGADVTATKGVRRSNIDSTR